MLTDVDGVFDTWGSSDQSLIRNATPDEPGRKSFPVGSMGPRVEAACDFASNAGRVAIIGRPADFMGLIDGTTGTRVGVSPPDS